MASGSGGAGNTADQRLDLALREYEIVRESITAYDQHLFAIRQWSIGLTAASLAAILGMAQTGGAKMFDFRPSHALIGFTLLNLSFWLLDALNKSLQMVHIYNSRDIELQIAKGLVHYKCPTISLRFARKEGRHFVEIVKNMSEQSVAPFYFLPLVTFWVVVLIRFRTYYCVPFVQVCSVDQISLSRIATIVTAAAVMALLGISFIWNSGRGRANGKTCGWWRMEKYFLRPMGYHRAKATLTISNYLMRQRIASSDTFHPPFTPDWVYQHGPGTPALILFVDRYSVFRNRAYRASRRKWLEEMGHTVIEANWKKKAGWFSRPAVDCKQCVRKVHRGLRALRAQSQSRPPAPLAFPAPTP